MRLLSSVLGWSDTELFGRIDVRQDSYLSGVAGASGTLATEYLAQCSAALFTLLALSSEATAQPRTGMLIASRSLSLIRPTFSFGSLLGVVQAQSSLPEQHSSDAILIRFTGTLSTLNSDHPEDEIMIQHEPGSLAMPADELRERAGSNVVARAEFSVYLPALDSNQ